MTTTNTTTSGASDLPKAQHPAAERDELLQVAIDFIGTLTGMKPPPIEVAPPEVFAPFRAFVDQVQSVTSRYAALAAGQATAAKPAAPPNAITASVMRDDGGEAPAFCLMAAYRSEKDAMDAFAMLAAAPAQPAAQQPQGVAYAALPDLSDAEGEIWSAILDWGHAKRGEDALRKASELERVLVDQLRAFADATCTLRASHGKAPAEVSPTAGMSIPQRILHVGGRNNDAGYVEFGSIQAVEALVRQVLRDLPALAQADSVQEDAADPLQGAANWLVSAHTDLAVSTLAGKLSIGCNRAKRLFDAALAAKKGETT